MPQLRLKCSQQVHPVARALREVLKLVNPEVTIGPCVRHVPKLCRAGRDCSHFNLGPLDAGGLLGAQRLMRRNDSHPAEKRVDRIDVHGSPPGRASTSHRPRRPKDSAAGARSGGAS